MTYVHGVNNHYLTNVNIFFIFCLLQEAQAYAEENGLLFMETSAKTAMNVNDIFLAIGEWFEMN